MVYFKCSLYFWKIKMISLIYWNLDLKCRYRNISVDFPYNQILLLIMQFDGKEAKALLMELNKYKFRNFHFKKYI